MAFGGSKSDGQQGEQRPRRTPEGPREGSRPACALIDDRVQRKARRRLHLLLDELLMRNQVADRNVVVPLEVFDGQLVRAPLAPLTGGAGENLRELLKDLCETVAGPSQLGRRSLGDVAKRHQLARRVLVELEQGELVVDGVEEDDDGALADEAAPKSLPGWSEREV